MAKPQILDEFGRPYRRPSTSSDSRLREIRASVDAAQTTPENARHWAGADSYSADAAFDPATRATLRNRSRYETLNNGYAKGSNRASADDTIGTGPRLQLMLPPLEDGTSSAKAAKIIERHYQEWSDEVEHGINLYIAQQSYDRDGGSFGLLDSNLDQRHKVKLFIRWLEDEFCQTPFSMLSDPFMVDGIKLNRLGQPVTYYFLRSHPGGPQFLGNRPTDYFSVPAEQVVHWFPQDRHGQHRGIPENTPALPLYSQLRRYTLATLTAAEFAAMLAGIMKTQKGEPDPYNPEQTSLGDIPRFELIELVRGALLTLPGGWEATQFKPEQPTTTYGDFKREILNEGGRAMGQPLNVVSGNSSMYNFSSGRLDHLPYQRGITIKRNRLRLRVQDKVFRTYVHEAFMVGIIPDGVAPLSEWRWRWNWDGFDSIDQNKDAQADDMRLKNGTSTYAEIFAAYGQDWLEEFDQMAREREEAMERGLVLPMMQPMQQAAPARRDPEDTEDVEDAVTAAMEEAGVSPKLQGDVMDALQPTFALLKSRGFSFAPSTNGKH